MKIKYYVNLNIEVPDNAIKEVIDTLIVQRRFFSNYYCFERYKKINVKVNEDIGKNIINVYLYATPFNFSTNINDERAIFEILKQEEDFFKNSFSIDDLYEKLAIVVDTFPGPFKEKIEEKIEVLIEEAARLKQIIECKKEYKLNVKAIFSKALKI